LRFAEESSEQGRLLARRMGMDGRLKAEADGDVGAPRDGGGCGALALTRRGARA